MTLASDDSDNYMSTEDGDESAVQLGARWYAVQVASGCENRVKMNLEQRIETLDVANRILQIEIPQTPIIKP
ncbi:MAG TPA: transcription termination/antitermination NusG family protein, partial [Coleofasciculaceae cyanobacterium]